LIEKLFGESFFIGKAGKLSYSIVIRGNSKSREKKMEVKI